MSARRRKPLEDEIQTPLLKLIDFFSNCSALLNSIFDGLEYKTRIAFGRPARGAIVLAFFLWLAAQYPTTVSFIVTGNSAYILVAVLVTLAVVDIIVRTVRPRNLRYQARLQEISQGIAQGKFPPTYAAGYLKEIDFSSEQLDQLVHAFDNLPPSVQSSLVRNQILTSQQLARLCKHSVESSVIATLLKKYPHAFSASQLDAWIRGFPSSQNVVLTIASLQRIECAWWQPYLQGGLLSDELSRRIKAEIEYAKRPSRLSAFFVAHSKPLSYLLAIPVFLGLAYWYLTYPGRPVVSVPIGDTLAAVLSSILIGVFGLLMFMIIFAIASASLGAILRAIGNWIENSSKDKIGSNLA